MVTVWDIETSLGEALSVIDAPPAGAAELNDTVQVEDTVGDIEIGLQEKPFKPGFSVTLPVVVAVATGTPVAALDTMLTSPTAAVGSGADDDTVRFTVATMPFESPVVFKPHTTQVIGAVLEQARDLPAAETMGPAATVTELKSDAGYESVNCSEAGGTAPTPLKLTFRTNDLPGLAEPDETPSDKDCPLQRSDIPATMIMKRNTRDKN